MEQQLLLPPPRGVSSIGTVVRPERDLNEMHDELVEKGWTPLEDGPGDGAYTSVYLSPDGSRVLKFADGWGQQATVNAALAHPDNPHLPRILAVLDDVGGYDLAYEAEFLEALPDEETYDWDDEDTWPVDYLLWERQWGPNRASFARKRNGPMKDALKALHAAYGGDGIYWDVHPWNIMRRPSDGQLVLNDLLA